MNLLVPPSCFPMKPLRSNFCIFISNGLPPSLSALTVKETESQSYVLQYQPDKKIITTNKLYIEVLIFFSGMALSLFHNVHREHEQGPLDFQSEPRT